jgi:hypothetical protein
VFSETFSPGPDHLVAAACGLTLTVFGVILLARAPAAELEGP